MQRELLTNTFSSESIRSHYFDARAQAYAFLFTVGAKALVLEEQKAASSIDHDGIRDEAEIRSRMVTEERIRSIRRRILSRSSLSVLKRGRNEKVRSVDIVLHHDRKNTFLTWRSKLNYEKRFEVTNGTIVSRAQDRLESINEQRGRSLSAPESRRGSTSFELGVINPKRKLTLREPATTNAIFIRLTNQARSLDLSFQTELEMEAFLLVLQKHIGVTVQSDVLQNNHRPLPLTP